MGRHIKLCMIAGERSGDLHGAMVASQIKSAYPDVEIFGMGGARMREAGVEVIHDMTEIAVVGFLEVLRNLGTFRSIFHDLVRHVDERRPDAVILIDLPGFNLRFGPRVKKMGIPIVYYISPQTWAWGKWRTKKMREFIDKFYVILPFEVEFYRNEGIEVEYVGHPLVDVLRTDHSREEFRALLGVGDGEKLVSLLPGSREQEIERILPLMISTAQRIRHELPDTKFVVPAASEYLKDKVLSMTSASDVEMDVRTNNVYDIMNASDAAIVSSGTATLEMGWFGVPFVLVYRVSFLSYLMAKCVAKVDMIGLLNIMAGRTIVTEYVQRDARPGDVAEEITRYLIDEKAAEQKRRELLCVRDLLGESGAAKRVAEGIIAFVHSRM